VFLPLVGKGNQERVRSDIIQQNGHPLANDGIGRNKCPMKTVVVCDIYGLGRRKSKKMPQRAVEQFPVISLRRDSYAPCRDREMRLDDGDAWRLINVVFWGILLLVSIRLALALMLMI
jgi:hypothetical protein